MVNRMGHGTQSDNAMDMYRLLRIDVLLGSIPPRYLLVDKAETAGRYLGSVADDDRGSCNGCARRYFLAYIVNTTGNYSFLPVVLF